MSNLNCATDCLNTADDIGIFDTLQKLYRRKMVISIPMSPETAETDMYELDLSVRAYNCLYRAGARTIGDVVRHINESSIKTLRNMSGKFAKEVYRKTMEFCYDRLTLLQKLRFFEAIIK